jgi:hypothetical protein
MCRKKWFLGISEAGKENYTNYFKIVIEWWVFKHIVILSTLHHHIISLDITYIYIIIITIH